MTKRAAVTFWCNVAMMQGFPKVVEEALDAFDREDHEGLRRAADTLTVLFADVEEYVPVGAC